MFGMDFNIDVDFGSLERATDEAIARNLDLMGREITEDVRGSIQVSSVPSQPGQPPHTRGGGHGLGESIDYDVGKNDMVSGPRFSFVGLSGEAHEFGGEFRGRMYPAREFMQPALLRAIPRFGDSFEGSIGV